MRLTLPLSRDLDLDKIPDPKRTGAVDWTQFNTNFEHLLSTRWRDVNQGAHCSRPRRLLRLLLAFLQQKRNAVLDFEGKLRVLSKLRIPPNPDIVYFGAEAGWEAAILQALFGSEGKVVLIDQDPMAYQRFLHAPHSIRVRAPRHWNEPRFLVERDPAAMQYVRQDFFEFETDTKFDVGIDWGLIEHYDDVGKLELVARFRDFLKPSGLQICSCPRNRLAVRLFYRAFAEELNVGYRELMTLGELVALLQRTGCRIEDQYTLQAHNVVTYRWGLGNPFA